MNDTFRKKYHDLQKQHADTVQLIKSKAEDVEEIMREYIPSREMALALTNLEQAMMWATKAIVLHDQREQQANIK
jgi:hypothetical protein